MKNFNEFSKFKDYLESISNSTSQLFSFRAGVFDDNRFSFNGSGNFFKDFFPLAAPIKPNKIDTPVGPMTHRTITVDSNFFFEPVKSFVRQGDIFKSN